MTLDDILLAQGPAKPATPEDIEKDEEGITKPNLHRRISPGQASKVVAEYLTTTADFVITTESDDCLTVPVSESSEYPEDYMVSVNAVNSYRTISVITHNEEDNPSEIP